MKVILLADVKGLGKAGDTKEVKNGYGFNYLIPESLADLATPGAVKQAARVIAKRKEIHTAAVESDKALALTLDGKAVLIKSKAKNGKLFGSVGAEEIAMALEALGSKVDHKMIVLEKGLKEIGTFPVVVDFGHGVKATLSLTIEAA